MHFTTIPLLLAATLAPGVLGHGYLKEIIVDGKSYGGWQPYSDPYITPTPVRYTRVFPDNGPVPDFTTADITCNKGGNIPIANNIPVTAGSQVKFQWDQWGSSHSGPVMTYVAKCPGDFSTCKANTGNVWVKIDEWGYKADQTPPWGSDKLASLGASWTVTIPKSLSNGNYLLRHEILGLHVASTRMGAQFYPSCAQIVITGGGSANPTGVALPGAYDPDHPGILAELWKFNQGLAVYQAPGGSVWTG
ncbi:glycoside hydrolase [Tricharina praecox]|uniref:glycoside hydrolase n=1 Tax=Tricharina praecox TaxID=43433 RepID=UPI0022210FC8|nr:glycoside hydrolase [Tricharina praecox]KAI5849930.1 glycoside hydrolase [Tricharina praecox]